MFRVSGETDQVSWTAVQLNVRLLSATWSREVRVLNEQHCFCKPYRLCLIHNWYSQFNVWDLRFSYWGTLTSRSSGIWRRVVWSISTNVSEKPAASIFSILISYFPLSLEDPTVTMVSHFYTVYWIILKIITFSNVPILIRTISAESGKVRLHNY
jgi:hypothetical protein